MSVPLLVIGAALLIWALWSRLFRKATVNGPIVMTALGLLAGALLPGQGELFLDSKATLFFAEIVLAYLLFVDALEVRGSLRSHFTGVPARLLGIGLPLSLILVLAVGLVLPLGLSIAVILAIACISVPADFSPETSLVRDSRVPARVRRWLSIESGYNDGLVSPFLLGAVAFAAAGTTSDAGRAFAVAAPAGLIAILVGAVAGAVIGGAIRFADRRGWTEPQSMRIAFIAAPLIVFGLALALQGNGFVAVFVAGVAVRLTRGTDPLAAAEITLLEDLSWLLNLLLWLAFGFAAIVLLSETYEWWPAIVLALVALTLGRFLPVLLSLIGSDATPKERLFVAAMGPRGAASIVFGLIAANALPGEEGFLVLAATCMVVLGSVVLHGIAGPLMVRWLWPAQVGAR
ncbi:cation:proton antiporter [Microbacterium sp. 5K110]|uniref:cation:proton antiporter domain-containing protein n=1 Tax=unclassified Microbacterium TaxID=2609290 RepID=UPI0010FD2D57|nr:cation:proton antiporter [Microbacterium sp. 5K110]TLF32950.1 sodium:proton antiporter [Microbacterium sp. 5K110]